MEGETYAWLWLSIPATHTSCGTSNAEKYAVILMKWRKIRPCLVWTWHVASPVVGFIYWFTILLQFVSFNLWGAPLFCVNCLHASTLMITFRTFLLWIYSVSVSVMMSFDIQTTNGRLHKKSQGDDSLFKPNFMFSCTKNKTNKNNNNKPTLLHVSF